MSTIWLDLVHAQRMEDDRLVDPVEELGKERGREHVLDLAPHRGLVAGSGQVGDDLAAQVRGHDDDGVAEIDGPPLAVGQPAVVEHLEQDVEHVAVGLLDLVEEHDRVGPAADRLGEPAPFLVADVAGRSADQAGDVVPLAVLAHVEADHGRLAVEEELRQGLGQLGLADAGRTQEQERADRPVGVLQSGAAAADRVGDRVHGVVLVHHPEVDLVFELRSSFSRSVVSMRETGMPVHWLTTSAISSESTSFLSSRCFSLAGPAVAAAASASAISLSRCFPLGVEARPEPGTGVSSGRSPRCCMLADLVPGAACTRS